MADAAREHHWVARAPGGATASRWHPDRDCPALEMQRNADSLAAGEYGIMDATTETLRALGIATGEGGMCAHCKRRREVDAMIANTTEAQPEIHRGREIVYRWAQLADLGPFEIVATQTDSEGTQWFYRTGSMRAYRAGAYALGPVVPWMRANDNEATAMGPRLIRTDGTTSIHEAFTAEPPHALALVFEQIRDTWGAAERLRNATDRPSLLFRAGEVLGRLVMNEDISVDQAAQFGNWIKEQATVTAALNAILGTGDLS